MVGMCGRIGYVVTRAELVASYPWLREIAEAPPRYNIAPTDPVVVVGREKAELLPWGIEGRKGLFNLRTETVIRGGPHHQLLFGRRAIVPASHFYEWRRLGSHRMPVAVSRRDGLPLNLAALVGRWSGGRGVTVLTTTPNADLSPIHNRMPVLLSDEDAATWALEELGLEQLTAMLQPYAAGALLIRPASPLVNDVRKDGPELLDPDALPDGWQLDLIG